MSESQPEDPDLLDSVEAIGRDAKELYAATRKDEGISIARAKELRQQLELRLRLIPECSRSTPQGRRLDADTEATLAELRNELRAERGVRLRCTWT